MENTRKINAQNIYIPYIVSIQISQNPKWNFFELRTFAKKVKITYLHTQTHQSNQTNRVFSCFVINNEPTISTLSFELKGPDWKLGFYFSILHQERNEKKRNLNGFFVVIVGLLTIAAITRLRMSRRNAKDFYIFFGLHLLIFTHTNFVSFGKIILCRISCKKKNRFISVYMSILYENFVANWITMEECFNEIHRTKKQLRLTPFNTY